MMVSGAENLKPIYFEGRVIGYIPCGESRISKYFVMEFSV